MRFGLKRDREIERWLKPFTARVRMPGYQLVTFESTRLFFHLFWKLEMLGYTEQQIADHAVTWGHRSQLRRELALVQAVFDLAEHNELEVTEPFVPFLAA